MNVALGLLIGQKAKEHKIMVNFHKTIVVAVAVVDFCRSKIDLLVLLQKFVDLVIFL